MIPFQILAKFWLHRIQIADRTDNHRLLFDYHQYPKIILNPGARLDLDATDDTKRRCRLAKVVRQERRRIRDLWIGRPLRASRVVKMEMGIDDRDGISLRTGHGCCNGGAGRSKKSSAIRWGVKTLGRCV